MRTTIPRILVAGLLAGPMAATAANVTQLVGPGGLTLVNDFESVRDNSAVNFLSSTDAARELAFRWTSSVTPSGTWGLVEIGFQAALVGTLSSPATAVGLWFGNDDFGLVFDAILRVYSGATLLGSVSLASNGNDFADQFLGLESDTPFDSFDVLYQRPEAQMLAVYVDDVYVRAAPESDTLALFGLGLAGLGLSLRRLTA
jgi:hypothetical protein